MDKLDILPGKKTYIIVALAIVLNVLTHFDIVSIAAISENMALINQCGGFLGLATLYKGATR